MSNIVQFLLNLTIQVNPKELITNKGRIYQDHINGVCEAVCELFDARFRVFDDDMSDLPTHSIVWNILCLMRCAYVSIISCDIVVICDLSFLTLLELYLTFWQYWVIVLNIYILWIYGHQYTEHPEVVS